MSSAVRSRLRSPLSLALVGIVVLVLLAGIVGHLGDDAPAASAAPPAGDHRLTTPAVGDPPATETRTSAPSDDPADPPDPPSYVEPAAPAIPRKPQLPGGGYRIFGDHRFLVAYYGTAQTGAMGVLGATDPDTMQRRLMRAARPFREPGEHIQPVYELIVTVADRSPGPDHDFSHDIPRDLSSSTSGPPTATAPSCCWTSRPDVLRSRWSPSAGPGRCGSRGSGSPSTPSGGWGRTRCPPR